MKNALRKLWFVGAVPFAVLLALQPVFASERLSHITGATLLAFAITAAWVASMLRNDPPARDTAPGRSHR